VFVIAKQAHLPLQRTPTIIALLPVQAIRPNSVEEIALVIIVIQVMQGRILYGVYIIPGMAIKACSIRMCRKK
jgi:hypothetical protein